MPHVSRRPLTKKAEKELLKTFEIVMSKIGKTEEMGGFLSSLLSPTERIMLAKRLAIVILLKQGMQETDIGNALCVTRGTVDRLKLLFETKGLGYQTAIEILRKEELLASFNDFLISLARYSVRAVGGRV